MSRTPPPPVWEVVERDEFEAEVVGSMEEETTKEEAGFQPHPSSVPPPSSPPTLPPALLQVFTGFLLKKREKFSMGFLGLSPWRSRWTEVIPGARQMRYFEEGSEHGAPRDVLWLAAGTRVDVEWPSSAKGRRGSGGVGGATTGSSGSSIVDISYLPSKITPYPTPKFSEADLAKVTISHPATPEKYLFAWPIPSGEGVVGAAASASARASVEAWVAVIRKAGEGDSREGVAQVNSGKTPEGLTLRKGLKIHDKDIPTALSLASSSSSSSSSSASASASASASSPVAKLSPATLGGSPSKPIARLGSFGTPSSPNSSTDSPFRSTANPTAATAASTTTTTTPINVASSSPTSPLAQPSTSALASSTPATPAAALPPQPQQQQQQPQQQQPQQLFSPALLVRDPHYYPLQSPWGALLASKMGELLGLASESHPLHAATYTANGVKNGVTYWKTRDGSPGCKGVGVVPYSRAVVVDLVVDIGRRGEYDTQFDRGRVCGVLEGGNAKFTWMRFHGKGMGLVAPRDFFTLVHWRVDPDTGVYSVVSVSVDEGKVVGGEGVVGLNAAAGTGTGGYRAVTEKERAGCVRGEIIIGGWIVQPLPGVSGASTGTSSSSTTSSSSPLPPHAHPSVDAQGCQVTYLQKSNLGGGIPDWITADVVAQQAGCVHAVKLALDRSVGEGKRTKPNLPPLLNSLPPRAAGAGAVVDLNAAPPLASLPPIPATPIRQLDSSLLQQEQQGLQGLQKQQQQEDARLQQQPSAVAVAAAADSIIPPIKPAAAAAAAAASVGLSNFTTPTPSSSSSSPSPSSEGGGGALTPTLASRVHTLAGGSLTLVLLCSSLGALFFPASGLAAGGLAGVCLYLSLPPPTHIPTTQRLLLFALYLPMLSTPLPSLGLPRGLGHCVVVGGVLRYAVDAVVRVLFDTTAPGVGGGATAAAAAAASAAAAAAAATTTVAGRVTWGMEVMLVVQGVLLCSVLLGRVGGVEGRDWATAIAAMPTALRAAFGAV